MALAVLAAIGVLAGAGLLVALHVLPTGLHPLGTAVAVCAGATLLGRAVAPLRPVLGLVERALYATSIAWLLIAALSLL